MFHQTRKDALAAIEDMRKQLCMSPDASRCDCKYGHEGFPELAWTTESNGCPELRNIVELLECLTDAEYTFILQRDKK